VGTSALAAVACAKKHVYEQCTRRLITRIAVAVK
jgi:hypothetical protein